MTEQSGMIEVCAHLPASPNLVAKVAAELDQICRELEDIGVSLCADPEVVLRCINQLQRLDELGQRSSWLARVISAEDPRRLVGEITLDSLAARLLA